ncbi:uncharacterized protein [Typha latifolia]|uniref:uncharacterized protein n=1 Tax=Typha latifolia TaxID=4733 RepID=UPI003C2BBD73
MASIAAANGGVTANRNGAMAFALCKHLSLDPKEISSKSIEESDIASLFSNILHSSAREAPLQNQDEITKWVTFANNFPIKTDSCNATLRGLNEDLTQRAVLLGRGLKPSVADLVLFSAIHPFVSHLSDRDLREIPHVLRWIDYIQNIEDWVGMLEMIKIKKPEFEAFHLKNDKTDGDLGPKKVAPGVKSVDNVEGNAGSKKVFSETKASEKDKSNTVTSKNSKASEEKKKAPVESSEKDSECNISILNIQVGIIRKAWKHPSADSLLVEEIDLGDGNLRQVVSGLAKYFSPDELVNRRVVLITNVKPGKLRDVMSAGLVLCASNQDHTVVEPLTPPEGATIGERVSFVGYEGKPEDVLNPKKKQLEKITPHLYTDDKGIATFKGITFTTSAGPCTSSIFNASIK